MKYRKIKSKYKKKKSFWETKVGEIIRDSVCKFAEIIMFPMIAIGNGTNRLFCKYENSDFYKRRQIKKVKKENLRNTYKLLINILRDKSEAYFIVKNKDKIQEVSDVLSVGADFIEKVLILNYIDYISSWMMNCTILGIPKFNGVEYEIESSETTMRIILESLQNDPSLIVEEVTIVGVEQGSIYSIREK